MSVIAAQPQELKLNIRNRTGVQVELNLQDPNGNLSFYKVEEGVSLITLTEGVYTYWADLPCGHIAGTWNVNVVKTLFLSCQNELPNVLLTRIENGKPVSCEVPGVYVTITATGDMSPEIGDWFFSEEFTSMDSQTMYFDFIAALNDAGTDEGTATIGCWDGITPKDEDIQWSSVSIIDPGPQ